MNTAWIYQLLESDLVPDFAIRWGIRQMLAQKLKEEASPTQTERQAKLMAFVEELRNSPIAIETIAANEQHYEVPSRFFELTLGPRLKYSSAYWYPETQNLAEAEEDMLDLVCDRAHIHDGQQILDLGCGWGSMSLWLAEKYPHSQITGLSNSSSQKKRIEAVAHQKGFKNLTIITANIVDWEPSLEHLQRFDRIVSIEMFEHMKNYERLLNKVSRCLKDNGQLFIHIFTHKTYAYHYENKDGNDWLTEHFFSGGTMPSNDLLLHFQDDVSLVNQWVVNGSHYEKTANAWHENALKNKQEIWPILEKAYGPQQARRWWVYWKLFFLACAELWGYKQGEEWQVSHYLFKKATKN